MTAQRQAFTARYLRHLLPAQLKGTPTGDLLVQLKTAAAVRGLTLLRYETKVERRYDLTVTYALHPANEPEPEEAKDFVGELRADLQGNEGTTSRSKAYQALHQLLAAVRAR